MKQQQVEQCTELLPEITKPELCHLVLKPSAYAVSCLELKRRDWGDCLVENSIMKLFCF